MSGHGLRARVDRELHEGAEFLRGLDPGAIRARLRASPAQDGASRDGRGDLRGRLDAERAEARELRARMAPREIAGRLPSASPFVIVALAFALGVALARLVAARAHAHPR